MLPHYALPPHKQNGDSVLSLAACNGQLPVVRLMISRYGCSVNERLKVTCRCLPIDCVTCCDGVHAVCVQTGFTPLLSAAQYGHLHIVRELAEKMNADLLAQTSVCMTCQICV